jgi:hypothetical protein
LYDNPKSPVIKLATNAKYWSVIGWSSENLSATFSDSPLPSFAEIYLSVGSPGDNLINTNRKLSRRKSVNNEDKNRNDIVFNISDFINVI